MVPNKNITALSIEYFTFKKNDLWGFTNDELIKIASDELNQVGLINDVDILGGWVVKETESYPTYYLGYKEPYNILKNEISKFKNITPIGRGGMYKYNNQDHSTYSGLLAARNFLKLTKNPYNLWNINIDAEYQETGEF